MTLTLTVIDTLPASKSRKGGIRRLSEQNQAIFDAVIAADGLFVNVGTLLAGAAATCKTLNKHVTEGVGTIRYTNAGGTTCFFLSKPETEATAKAAKKS